MSIVSVFWSLPTADATIRANAISFTDGNSTLISGETRTLSSENCLCSDTIDFNESISS